MAINHVVIKNFGPFANLDLGFSPGLNVVLGENGTGKTFLLKLLYAVTTATEGFERKLVDIFGLRQDCLSSLVRYEQPSGTVRVEYSDGTTVGITIPTKRKANVVVEGEDSYKRRQHPDVGIIYIPTDDVLANIALFKDLRNYVFLDKLMCTNFSKLLADLEKVIGGKVVAEKHCVVIDNERIYIKDGRNMRDIALQSETSRRLALLWLLLRNGTIRPGSILFWDAPETNLNHRVERVVADVLAALSADGVQMFVTTNSLFLLREFEIKVSKKRFPTRYVNLQKTEDGVRVEQGDSPAEIGPIAALEESLLQADRYMEV